MKSVDIFSKILTHTDTRVRLQFPTRALDHFHFPEEHDHFVKFWVTDAAQKQWKFRLAKRKEGNYRKPAITGDWTKFVKTKYLKEGDKVFLYKLVDEATGGVHYRIVVKKKIAFLGPAIHADEN